MPPAPLIPKGGPSPWVDFPLGTRARDGQLNCHFLFLNEINES